MKKRIHQIELFTKYPIEVQEELLGELLSKGKDTVFGEKHSFKKIDNIQDYRQGVPVNEYEDLEPYIKRIKEGEQNVLWNTEIKWFAKSSGTTNHKSKFIPVSKEALEECHYKGGKDMLSIYCNHNKESQVFTGKTLMMGGSSQTIDPNIDSYQGDLSSIIIKNLPFWAEIRRTPSREVALMKDFEQKLEKMAKGLISENITSISGVPSWVMILLNKTLSHAKVDNLCEVWPNLEVFFHGGISFNPYKKQFKNLLPNEGMFYVETYNASEGFFGIEDLEHPGELLLMLDYGIYYEMAPQSEWGKKFPSTIGLDEIEIGKNYALIITTNAGLWRYKIGDTVQFTSKYPFRIKISGRTKHFLNAFGEEVIIDNAEKALDYACKKTQAQIEEYTAAPEFLTSNKAGKHQWLIEFNKLPNDIDAFAHYLDDELKRVNSDYEAKRQGNLALDLPKVMSMEKGTFFNWMKSRNKLGGQNKVPRLSNNRQYVEELLNLEQPSNLNAIK